MYYTNDIKLLPCPFCGSNKIKVDDEGSPVIIKCEDCAVRVGWFVDQTEAVSFWNRRVLCVD